MPEFVTLKCQSCGAALDVYPDMERFACGYCGTDTVVHRRGGTITLKLVEAAIQRVQVGTDKTAAELAIARLQSEATQLEAEKQRVSNAQGGATVFGCGCAVVVLLFGLPLLLVESTRFIGIVACIIVVVLLIYSSKPPSSDRAREVDAKLEEIQQQIAEKKRIVDG